MMLLESSNQSNSNEPSSTHRPVRLRLRFRKDGLLRLVSHHDLMQCFEMMFRRAQLPFASTQGFHPKPKMAFALSLALGVIGCEEVVEIELLEEIEPFELRRRLNEQCPNGIEILSVTNVDRKNKARVVLVGYRIVIPSDRHAELARLVDEFRNLSQHWIERKGPKSKRIDIITHINKIELQNRFLQMELFVFPTGMVRPDEILSVLGVGDLLDAGVVLERNRMVLMDEINEAILTNSRLTQTGTQTKISEAKSRGPTSLVPGPMSFDT